MRLSYFQVRSTRLKLRLLTQLPGNDGLKKLIRFGGESRRGTLSRVPCVPTSEKLRRTYGSRQTRGQLSLGYFPDPKADPDSGRR